MSRKKIQKPKTAFKVTVENDGIYVAALKKDNAQLTDDIPNEYCNSKCECVLCNNLNIIKQKWLIWEPENNLQLLLKTHIDNMS